jgi:hypothetical protein
MAALEMNETPNLNHLRRGGIYRVTTASGVTLGEYLGMEAVHGEHAVLLRNRFGTESILRTDIVSIELSA